MHGHHQSSPLNTDCLGTPTFLPLLSLLLLLLFYCFIMYPRLASNSNWSSCSSFLRASIWDLVLGLYFGGCLFCACVHVCVVLCVYEYTYRQACRGQRASGVLLYCSQLYSLEPGFLTERGAHHFQLVWLAREPYGSSSLAPHGTGVTGAHDHTWIFFLGAGDLNSGLHICISCALAHWTPPTPSQFFFKQVLTLALPGL